MTIKLKDYIKENTNMSENEILKSLQRILFKGDNNMSIMYGKRYEVKTVSSKLLSVGAIVKDYQNNSEFLINELELLAITGKMHILSVQNYGELLDEDSVDKVVEYVLDLKSKLSQEE